MKKLTALIMSLLVMASLVACGSHEASAPVSSEHEFSKSERVQTSEPENEVPQISDNSTLVVYFPCRKRPILTI